MAIGFQVYLLGPTTHPSQLPEGAWPGLEGGTLPVPGASPSGSSAGLGLASTRPWRQGLRAGEAHWLALPPISSWPEGSQQPQEQRVDCAPLRAHSPPSAAPAGPAGDVCVCSQARLLRPTCKGPVRGGSRHPPLLGSPGACAGRECCVLPSGPHAPRGGACLASSPVQTPPVASWDHPPAPSTRSWSSHPSGLHARTPLCPVPPPKSPSVWGASGSGSLSQGAKRGQAPGPQESKVETGVTAPATAWYHNPNTLRPAAPSTTHPRGTPVCRCSHQRPALLSPRWVILGRGLTPTSAHSAVLHSDRLTHSRPPHPAAMPASGQLRAGPGDVGPSTREARRRWAPHRWGESTVLTARNGAGSGWQSPRQGSQCAPAQPPSREGARGLTRPPHPHC